jgi:competence protein ComEC
MIATGIALTCGTLLALFEPEPVDLFWCTFLPVSLYLAMLNGRWRGLWVMVTGFLWATLYAGWQLDQRLPGELNNKRLAVVGEVLNIPQRGPDFTRLLVRISALESDPGFIGVARLSWRQAPAELAAGQTWRFTVRLKQPHGFQNPGGFDYERWLFVRGVAATGYVIARQPAELLRDVSPGLTSLRSHIRQTIVSACGDCVHGGLVQALTIGFRGDIEPVENDLLRQTGTAHLIAISGLHIGIIAGWFFVLGQWLWSHGVLRERLNRRELALTIGWTAALLYSLLSGFELPAQRAMLMLSVVFAALWWRVPVSLLNSVALALIFVLILSPLSVLSASFWLSFCAVLVICLGLLLFGNQRHGLRKLLLYQVLFSLLLAPLSLAIFNQLHLASLLANLVAVPLVSLVIVPFNFILQLLFWLPESMLGALYLAEDHVLGWLLDYLQSLGDWGLGARWIAEISPWRMLCLVLFLLLLVLPRGLPMPRTWLALLPLVFLAPWFTREDSSLRMAVLDVGMGTSVVVSTRHHHLVYDFGAGREQGYSLGRWVVMPYLRNRGIDSVDRIVISHADQDHLGGFLGIRNDLDYAALFSGTPLEVKRKWPDAEALQDCHGARAWVWDGVAFEFLSSGRLPNESENNRSCVLRISTGEGSLLIAGDIEAEQEARLLAVYGDRLRADILVAPHHGSMTSSTPEFIDAVSPSQVIFTAGYLNRWRFPRAEIVDRYRQIGAEILRTDEHGAILIDCENSHCAGVAQRRLAPRLWY